LVGESEDRSHYVGDTEFGVGEIKGVLDLIFSTITVSVSLDVGTSGGASNEGFT